MALRDGAAQGRVRASACTRTRQLVGRSSWDGQVKLPSASECFGRVMETMAVGHRWRTVRHSKLRGQTTAGTGKARWLNIHRPIDISAGG